MEKIVQAPGRKDALRIQDGSEHLDGEYVIFTYTTGKGKTPKPVETFLAANPGVRAVVGSGSRTKSHIETFHFAAENISRAYQVPVIARLDGVGTPEKLNAIRSALEAM